MSAADRRLALIATGVLASVVVLLVAVALVDQFTAHAALTHDFSGWAGRRPP